MAKIKELANTRRHAAPVSTLERKIEQPETQTHRRPSVNRATNLTTPPAGAPRRARMMHNMQQAAGNHRVTRMLGETIQAKRANTPRNAQKRETDESFEPWTRVYIHQDGIVGEVVDSDVTVRIFKTYSDLRVKGPDAPYLNYYCGKHDTPLVQKMVGKMRQITQIAAQVNRSIPENEKTKRSRIALVAIHRGPRGIDSYRLADGKGAILLSKDQFDSGIFAHTIFHESSHGVFEFHRFLNAADRGADPLAVRIGDLYHRLQKTKSVPWPNAKFNRKKPPSLNLKHGEGGIAAGVTMVLEILWAGVDYGHPQENVDEFFASAYGAYQHDAGLFKEIIGYYSNADPDLPGMSEELFSLLKRAGNSKTYSELKEPVDSRAAKEEIEKVKSVTTLEDLTNMGIPESWLANPASMPSPGEFNCSKAPVHKDSSTNELLNP